VAQDYRAYDETKKTGASLKVDGEILALEGEAGGENGVKEGRGGIYFSAGRG
jgi:hypothetical protein